MCASPLKGLSHSSRLVPILTILVLGYLSVHLLTLGRSPVPWFDETFNASVTDSLIESGDLRLRVSPLWFDKPVYIYGPLYFALTSLTARVRPHEMFFYRLPCLLFSMGAVGLFWFILVGRRVAPAIAGLICVLLALDPTFYKSSHAARMDSMALFFVLLSLLAMPAAGRADHVVSVGRSLASGGAAGVALLTTPRPVYLLLGIGAILAFRAFRERSRARLAELAIWGGAAAVLYLPWFCYAFGSLPELIRYYLDVPGSYRFYLFGFRVRLVHVPVLAALLTLLVAVRDWKRLPSELLFFVAVGIVGFYAAIREPGLFYSLFMVSIAYLGIGQLSSLLAECGRERLALTVLSVLLALNAAAYLARHAFVIAQWQSIDGRTVDEAVARHVPPGSRVVGDDKYYYAVRKAGSDFQYLNRGGTPQARLAYHRDVYEAGYLITQADPQAPLIRAYARELDLVRIGVVPEQPPGVLARALERLANVFRFGPETGYGGDIWARRLRVAPGPVPPNRD